MLREPLENLANAYFNQDYDLDYDTPIEAVTDYKEVNPPESVHTLPQLAHQETPRPESSLSPGMPSAGDAEGATSRVSALAGPSRVVRT
ncbi:contact-dependent growth inhibition system immunity protein [Streptomyces sp. NPDC001910]|uniref:contact-dependent growth inhibition system immunity protein n=1 Tax=Streptomyces sp. NPDC001910 TaxID=3154403 RepID=UPI00331A7856